MEYVNDLNKILIELLMAKGIGNRKVFDVLGDDYTSMSVRGLEERIYRSNIYKDISRGSEGDGDDRMSGFIEELQYMRNNNVMCCSVCDNIYPVLLSKIYDPPVLFYYKGSIKASDTNAVAIVGSRKSTHYGIRTAERLGYELAVRGVTVISGFARGVDQAAHMGALRGGGRTIAVLGSGFDNIYPKGCNELLDKIVQSGAVITENNSFVRPEKGNFPKRNRIIAGLSQAVVVVEAKKNSGSLITANFALDEGRDVLAVPGNIDSVNSEGTNQLIKNGAKPVMSVDDILEDATVCQPEGNAYGSIHCSESAEIDSLPGSLTPDIERFIKNGPVHFDRIAELSGRSGLGLKKDLLTLEMTGHLKRLPGNFYERS